MIHTLEMVVKMRTGDVMSGLNGIENKIVNLVDQVSNFKPLNAVNENQIEVVSQINEAIRTTDRLTGLVNDRNVSNYIQAQKDLKVVEAKASALNETAGNAEKLAAINARNAGIAERLSKFYDNSRDILSKNVDLVEQLKNKNIQINKITNSQYKDLKEITKVLNSVKNHKEVINDELNLTSEEVENILENYNEIDKKAIGWRDTQNEIAKQKIGSFLYKNFDVLNMTINRLKELNRQFEDNRAVVNRHIGAIDESGDMFGELAKIQASAADSNILMSEAQESLTSALANGAAITIKDADAIANLTKNIAQSHRATGVSIGSLSNLSTAMVGLTDDTDAGAKTVQFITGAMDKMGISAKNAQSAVDALTNGLLEATLYLEGDELKEYEAGMAAISAAAAELHIDGTAAMNTFTNMIDPLNRTKHAALLTAGGLNNITEASPTEVLTATSNAMIKLSDELKAGSLSASALRKEYGLDKSEVHIYAKAAKEMKNIGITADDAASRSKQMVDAFNDVSQAGKDVQDGLPEDGIRRFNNAIDDLKVKLTPIVDALNKFIGYISSIVSTKFGQWLMITTALTVTYFKVIRPLVTTIGGLVGSLGRMAKVQDMVASSGSKMAKGGGGGGFLVGFSKQIRLASRNFAKVSWVGMLKGAVMLAAVAGSLALGIYLLGKASSTLQPTQIDQLVILIGGILAATALLIPLGKLGPQAIVGALAVGAVGAALAGGLALLGLAVGLWDESMTKNFIWLGGGLIIATALMAAVGLIAPAAIIGAVAVLAVGAALAGGLAILGLAVKLWDKRMVNNFILLAGGLVVATGLIAVIGVIAPAALAGSLALIAVAAALAGAMWIIGSTVGSLESFASGLDALVGSLGKLSPQMGESLLLIGTGLAAFAAALVGGEIAEFFGADVVEQAASMAQAMLTMQPAIESIASIGSDAAGAFKTIGEGLVAMSDSLSGDIMDFFGGDTVTNAKEMAAAMLLVVNPIEAISKMGDKTATTLMRMSVGLGNLVDVLKEEADWFDSFEDNAEDMAAAISKLVKPIKEITGAQQTNIESSIKDVAKVQAEEIRSALAVTIEKSSDNDEAILEKLDDLIVAVEQSGGGGGGSNQEHLEEARKSTELLQGIFNELAIGGTFGGSVADTRYNT